MKKKFFIVIINLATAGLHLLTGENYAGPFPRFVNGYMIDILLPLSFYLLLTLINLPPIKHAIIRFALIFGLASAVEIAQAFGIPIFGSTYDPVDFLMYALGALSGVLFDEIIIPKIFPEPI